MDEESNGKSMRVESVGQNRLGEVLQDWGNELEGISQNIYRHET